MGWSIDFMYEDQHERLAVGLFDEIQFLAGLFAEHNLALQTVSTFFHPVAVLKRLGSCAQSGVASSQTIAAKNIVRRIGGSSKKKGSGLFSVETAPQVGA